MTEVYSIKNTIIADDELEDCDCYKYIFMCTVISLGFINYSDTTFYYLRTDGIIKKDKDNSYMKLESYISFLDDILYFSNKPLSQIRLMSIGLINSLMNINFLSQNNSEYHKLFNVIVELLDNQKKDEAERLKVELQDEIDCGFIEEDDEEDNNIVEKKNNRLHLDDDLFPGYEEIKDVLSWFKTPISNYDEFNLFRKLVDDIKQTNYEVMIELVKSIEDKNVFQNILKIKRHQVGSREFVRNVVKIKRKVLNN